MISNRMRNIHSYLITKYGKESVGIYQRWEKFEYKMADFQNHRCFSLRCLSKSIIPTNVRLKTNIKMPKGKYIIKKAELALLNERIRSINNSIAMFKTIIDTCINQLESMVDKETMEECYMYMGSRREQRHLKTLERHLSKFSRLCHGITGGRSNSQCGKHDRNGHINTHTCMNTATTSESEQGQLRGINTNTSSNTSTSSTRTSNNNNNWVRNFSKTPLTDAQQCLLSHGPNFVIVPREPPTCKYIVATEKVYQQLTQGKAEELRGEVKSLLRKDHKTKPNIPRDEHQVLREIKRDNTRMVLTADKGVSLAVLYSEDYTAKSEELLYQPSYKILKADPINK